MSAAERPDAWAERLRAAFDGSFAEPAERRERRWEGFVTFRLGREAYAFPVQELTGVVRSPAIVPLPARLPAVLGLAGVQSALVPVLSLATLLGRPAAEERTPRWLALCRGETAVALGFDELAGYAAVPSDEILGETAEDASSPRGRSVRIDGTLHAVVEVAALLERLRKGGRDERP